jgi:glutathione S-transferase
MKLFYAPTSPFVRKVMISAHELGLVDRIELVPAAVSPINRNADVVAQNPLGKIPALVTDDGVALYDSRVICQYLNSVASGQVIPPEGPARWTALRDEALGDGLMDAAVLIRYETFVRPEPLRWQEWIDGKFEAARSAVRGIEAQAQALEGRNDIGVISIACALGYLDFRNPEFDWAALAPRTAKWFAGYKARPSFQATMPK